MGGLLRSYLFCIAPSLEGGGGGVIDTAVWGVDRVRLVLLSGVDSSVPLAPLFPLPENERHSIELPTDTCYPQGSTTEPPILRFNVS